MTDDETDIETHLALRHDAWRPKVPEPSGDLPVPNSTERVVALGALHSKFHDAEACDHSPTLDEESRADANQEDQRFPSGSGFGNQNLGNMRR